MSTKMRVGINVEVSLNNALFIPGWKTNPQIAYARDQFLDRLADRIIFHARRNVQPGVGPGPHPHRTRHIDTGTLMRSITRADTKDKWGRMIFVASSGINPINQVPAWKYGTILEMGWHAGKAGRFYRYLWLKPACDQASRYVSPYLQSYFWAPLRALISRATVQHTNVYVNGKLLNRVLTI